MTLFGNRNTLREHREEMNTQPFSTNELAFLMDLVVMEKRRIYHVSDGNKERLDKLEVIEEKLREVIIGEANERVN